MSRLIRMMAAVFTYVCPRCHQIFQFDSPKMYKCPKCDIFLIKK